MRNVRLVRELEFPSAAGLRQKLPRADVPRRGEKPCSSLQGASPNSFSQLLHLPLRWGTIRVSEAREVSLCKDLYFCERPPLSISFQSSLPQPDSCSSRPPKKENFLQKLDERKNKNKKPLTRIPDPGFPYLGKKACSPTLSSFAQLSVSNRI